MPLERREECRNIFSNERAYGLAASLEVYSEWWKRLRMEWSSGEFDWLSDRVLHGLFGAATRRSIVIGPDHSTFPLTMSLTSTGNIKAQLRTALGDKSPLYFSAFQLYLKALISRQEFEDQMRDCLDTPHLRAPSHHSSKRDSRAHFDMFSYSAVAQLTCDFSL